MADEQSGGPSRRRFLHGAAAGLGMAALAGGRGAEAAPAEPAMPSIQVGTHRVSRLVCGSNPMLGYSHVSRLMSRVMTDWYTPERIVSVVRRCWEVGVNTWQTSASEKVDQALATLRGDGVPIQWVFLANRAHFDPRKLKEIVRRNQPIAVVHHGGVSDSLWRAGKIERAHDFAKRVQDLGIPAGLSAHNPDVIRHAEDKGWDLDLYMTCFYRVTRTQAELKAEMGMAEVPLGETYLPGDPGRMCEVVRQVERPCLGFKILAAGRRCGNPRQVEGAFRFAFGHLKATDGVIVGMFPRFRDQAQENAALARRFGGAKG
ncbi:MAG: hypothetical protein ACODAJ_05025 [Planctomycetota bacterium]